MKHADILCLLSVLQIDTIAFAARASELPKEITVMVGDGHASCRLIPKISDSRTLMLQAGDGLQGWAIGFMSDLNEEKWRNGSETKDLTALSKRQLMNEFSKYCTDHPEEPFWNAVLALYSSLPDVQWERNSSN